MARRSPQTFVKRQREQKRAEKARQKLEKRKARKEGLTSVDPASLDDPDADPVEATDEVDEGTTPSEDTTPG